MKKNKKSIKLDKFEKHKIVNPDRIKGGVGGRHHGNANGIPPD